MRLVAPDDPIVDPILDRAEETCTRLGWTLLRVPEDQCADMLLTNRADAALISPIAYGKAAGVVEYNIVRGPCVALHDYTNLMGVYFSRDVQMIHHIGSTHPELFLVQIGAVLLRERFEADDATVIKFDDGTIVDPDCIIARPTLGAKTAMLDVSEEFSDLVEAPLPVFMWVCRMDADLDALPNAIVAMASTEIIEVTVDEVVHVQDDHFSREGKILYRWSEEVQEGLEAVLNLLFFHQSLPTLPEIKMLPSAP